MKRKFFFPSFCLSLIFLISLIAPTGRSLAETRYQRESKRHEQECRTWCAANERCDHCSTQRYCGQGYENLRSWTGYGKNWHACARKQSRDEASEENHRQCKQWCDATPGCDYCSSSCGTYHKKLKRWTGRGRNYYACGEKIRNDEHSRRNHQDCNDWCRANREVCTRCIPYTICEQHHTIVRTFGGLGQNWYACGNRNKLKAKNKADCEAWCGQHRDCEKCSRVRGCGPGYKRMQSFDIGGAEVDWHACKRREHASGTITPSNN